MTWLQSAVMDVSGRCHPCCGRSHVEGGVVLWEESC